MPTPENHTLNASIINFLAKANIDHQAVLTAAALPADTFSSSRTTYLSTDQLFRLWQGIDDTTKDPDILETMAQELNPEEFDPPLFAALCSPNLNIALQRIAYYKRLICPMKLTVDIRKQSTILNIEWGNSELIPPPLLVSVELIFFTFLARYATGKNIVARKITAPRKGIKDSVETYLGTKVTESSQLSMRFSAEDANLPFRSFDSGMWDFFEPELNRRLQKLDQTTPIKDQVHSVLLQLLPSGVSTIDAVAERLNFSRRTLQRKLKEEQVSYQDLLKDTRESLARHYLKSSSLTGAEISFLLGFADANSFFRAFHHWTGLTPNQVRYPEGILTG